MLMSSPFAELPDKPNPRPRREPVSGLGLGSLGIALLVLALAGGAFLGSSLGDVWAILAFVMALSPTVLGLCPLGMLLGILALFSRKRCWWAGLIGIAVNGAILFFFVRLL